jgi:PAS domain S-box-containing protein
MSPPGRLKTCRSGAMIESTPAECDARVKVVSFCTDRVHRFLPLQGPLAKDPTAQILHYLLSALAIWLTFSTLLVYLFTAVVARLNLFLVPSLLVMLLVALVLLRRGFLRAAGVVYLAGMLLYVTVIIVLTGGIRNAPGLVFYAALPISAAWLFGYRATLWMAGVCVSIPLVLTLFDLGGVNLHPFLPAKPLAAWSFLVMAILIAALPVALVLRTLRDALAESHRSEQVLATELDTAQRLRQVATQSITSAGMQALYDQILDTALTIVHADLASIQMLYPERGSGGELRLLGHRGFSPEAAKRWEWVSRDSRTTCGEALRTSRKITVADVRKCDFMAGSEDVKAFLEAGIHAAQSLPLVSRSGVLLGMVTAYWRQPHEQSESELRAWDILARLAGDVFERARADAVLSESQQRLASIYDTVRDVIFHLAVEPDGQFRFASVNAAFLRVTGLSAEAVIGRTVNEVIPEPSLTMVLGKYRQAIEGHTSVLWEETSDFPTGRLTGEVSLTPVFDNTGKCTHLVGSVHDITERKRAETALRRAQEQSFARQKLESVGTLAGGIAHDFNNLLGGVLAHAELALGELAAGSRPEDELKAIRNAAIRGSEIVRELMIYAGKDSEIRGLVDVSQIAKEMLELLRVSVSKHARLETDLGQHLPAVRTNAAQVRQIVMNLITNASEALGERDGVIRVTTRCVRVDPDSSTVMSGRLAHGDYLQLEVSDTGCGMSAETRARAFDPFFTTKSAGRGLGMAVVVGIVRSLGGEIHVDSEPGKGTKFQVLLPCGKAQAEATTDTMCGSEEFVHPSKECTVLIVEDEVPLRQAVVKKLRNSGFVVLEAPDGSAAIDLLKSNGDKIDVMLLDMTVPGTRSVEVVAEAAQTRPNIRVILTSAYSQEMVTAPLSTSQIRDFIRKPFQLGDLVETLRRASSAS